MTPGTARFFVTGGTLGQDAPSYVERAADEQLFAGLLAGEFCYVLTSRQMGKSSLMVRTAARLREEGVSVAVLDLTMAGRNLAPEQWYYGLLGYLGRQLNLHGELRDYWVQHDLLGPLQRFMGALRDVVLRRIPGRVVLFVDEIDAVRSLPFSTDEFFAAIREFFNRRPEDQSLHRITFCLIGVATPSDLIQDVRTTPFNIGRRIELHDFTPEEARPLAIGLALGEPGSLPRPDGLARRLLERVLYWTGGHPYLTQRLCQAVALEPEVRDASGVDRVCARIFLAAGARDRDDNLLFVRERLLRSREDVSDLLLLYERVWRGRRVYPNETDPRVGVLELSGVIRPSGSRLEVRNRIYRYVFNPEWIRVNLPDAESRRQQAAFRQGVLRATVVTLAVTVLLGSLLFAAVGAFRRAAAREQEARRSRYVAEVQLTQHALAGGDAARAQQLLERQRPRPGQEDLRGFEWGFLWRTVHQERAILYADRRVPGAVVFPREGELLSVTPSAVTVWDLETGRVRRQEPVHTLQEGVAYLAPAVSENGRVVAGTLQDQAGMDRPEASWQCLVVDRRTGQRRRLEGRGRARCLALSADGRYLAVGTGAPGRPGEVYLWDLHADRAALRRPAGAAPVVLLAFSPAGDRLIATGPERVLRIWRLPAGTPAARHPVPGPGYVTALRVSPDGRRAALALGDPDRPQDLSPVLLWDLETGRLLGRLPGRRGRSVDLAFSPTGDALATAGRDGSLRIWSIPARAEVRTLLGHQGMILGLARSADGRVLASSGADGAIRLWDWTLSPNPEVLPQRARGPVRSLTFSPDGSHLTAIVRTRSGEEMTVRDRLTGPQQPSLAVARAGPLPDLSGAGPRTPPSLPDLLPGSRWDFAADGQRVVVAGPSETVVWDLQRRRVLLRLPGLSATTSAFSRTGRYVALRNQRLLQVWELEGPRALLSLEPHGWPGGLAFSPDERTLAVASNDGTVHLIHLPARQEVALLTGKVAGFTALAFSPDGSCLAAGCTDGSRVVWRAVLPAEADRRQHAPGAAAASGPPGPL